jgi:hypothetical protein
MTRSVHRDRDETNQPGVTISRLQAGTVAMAWPGLAAGIFARAESDGVAVFLPSAAQVPWLVIWPRFPRSAIWYVIPE